MRVSKRGAAAALGVFLALAPPGTLIGLALAAAWVGRRWPLATWTLGIALVVAALAAAWRLLRRRRHGAPGGPPGERKE